VDSGKLTIQTITFIACSVGNGDKGGLFYVDGGGNIILDNVTVIADVVNNSKINGSVIYVSHGTASATRCCFENLGYDEGSVIKINSLNNVDSSINIINCDFTSISSDSSGSAISAYGINDNEATRYVNITQSTFTQCTTMNYGGALYIGTGIGFYVNANFISCTVKTGYSGTGYSSIGYSRRGFFATRTFSTFFNFFMFESEGEEFRFSFLSFFTFLKKKEGRKKKFFFLIFIHIHTLKSFLNLHS
jgi:hypothetical protein